MTTEHQKAARARCEAVGVTKWSIDLYKDTDLFTWVNRDGRPVFGTAGRARIADAEFTANAQTDLPAALDHIETQAAEIAVKDRRIAELEAELLKLADACVSVAE